MRIASYDAVFDLIKNDLQIEVTILGRYVTQRRLFLPKVTRLSIFRSNLHHLKDLLVGIDGDDGCGVELVVADLDYGVLVPRYFRGFNGLFAQGFSQTFVILFP